MTAWPLWLIAALIGPCLGSYAATAALRRAGGEQSTWGRSRCDGCGVSLGLARTVPILSFVQQRGVCAVCRSRIDPAHLVGEAAGGAIVLSAIFAAAPLRAFLLAALGLLLLSSAIYDAKTRRLPDDLTLAIGALSVALAISQSLQSLEIGLLSAVLSFLVLEGVRRLFLQLRRTPGLGLGDVKLIAAVALWTGAMTPWVVVVAALLGLGFVLVRPSPDGRLPFGPFIAAAAWLVGVGAEAGLLPVLA